MPTQVSAASLVPPAHPLWPVLNRESIEMDLLGCIASAASEYLEAKEPVRSAVGGSALYCGAMRNLQEFLVASFGATVEKKQGQIRFRFPAASGSHVTLILRRGRPTLEGFSSSGITTSVCGPATEQLSLAVETSLVEGDEVPLTVGLLLIYNLSQDISDHVEMWAAHEWRAREGSNLIVCNEVAFLGRAPIARQELGGRMAVGDSPVV